MTILEIAKNPNGSHSNQTSAQPVPLPQGWALLPPSVGTPETLEHFPFGEIAVDLGKRPPEITRWTPLPLPPAPEPPPESEPAGPSLEQRVEALEKSQREQVAAYRKGVESI